MSVVTARPRFVRIATVLALMPAMFFLSYQVAKAAISLSTTTTFVQTFDTIGNTATAPLPADFRVDKQTSARTLGNWTSALTATERVGGANLSTSAANGIYNFGAGTTSTGGTDRAIGFLSSSGGVNSGNLYGQFVNNTGGNLAGLQISYNVEKYRNGTNTSGFCIQMHYSTNGSVWTSAGSDFKTQFAGDPSATGNTGFATAPGLTVGVNKALNVSVPSGGTIYLAWNYSVCSGSTVTNSQALAIDDINVLGIGQSTGPTGIGSANPNSFITGNSTLLTVAVTPGSNPTSTGITVTADLSSIGGTATQQFYDDGTHGDVTAGDNTFSFFATVPANTPDGSRNLTATIADTQSRSSGATITLTVLPPPPPHVAIHDIQGTTQFSPWTGVKVETTGIVTGRRSTGFWIQTPDGEVDGDPNTSEGLFVFTGSGNVPASAQVGNLVSVTGTIQEFVSNGAPTMLPMTEMSGSPSTTLLSTGNTLPVPIALTSADFNPAGGLNQLEKYEHMRVSIASIDVVAPTGGFKTEAAATSSSDGVFWGVIPGTARPFREAGIEITQALPPDAPANVPLFDTNPERIRIDSDVQPGTTALNVTTGAKVTNLTGVIDIGGGWYTLNPEPGAVATGNVTATPVPNQTQDEFTVASFNLERFYDDFNDPNGDTVLNTTAYNNRLNKASLAIRNVLRTPDILAVVEMEKLSVLQALANKINNDAVAAGQPNPNYVAYLEEGNDVGGIDVGFLVKPAKVDVINVTQIGKTEPFQTGLLNDRPPLVLNAKIKNRPGRRDFPIYVIANHLRSLIDIEDVGATGDRVRHKREAQAEFLASLIQSLQNGNPDAHIVSVGDYNAFEVNDGYADVMGVIRGNPAPADQVTVAGPDLVNPDLTDLMVSALPPSQQYSYSFEGNAQIIDHILVTQALNPRLSRMAVARVNADFPDVYRSDANRPERISDHDAPVAFFNFPPPVADLSVAVTAITDPVTSGSTASFGIQVSNASGLDAAENATLTFDVPAGSTFWTLVSPSGWNCSTPTQGSTGVISCSNPSFASGDTASFTLNVKSDCAAAQGSMLSLVATASSSVGESDSSNNQAGAMAMVNNPAPSINNLTVSKTELLTVNHKLTDVILGYSTTDNCGTPNVQVSVSSNQPLNGTGDGNTSTDWVVVNNNKVSLRAERAGDGGDRIYTITVKATDSAGNNSSQSVNVVVPHDNR